MNDNNNGFFVQPAQYDFSIGSNSLLSGLQGLAGGQQQQPNAFASQTPGAPSQPGRVDQSSFGATPQVGDQMNGQDPIQMLMANIAKRFGSM